METKQVTSDKNKRLIDAMQLVTRLSKRIGTLVQLGVYPLQLYNDVLQVIAEAPTVNVVELRYGKFRKTKEEIETYGYDYTCLECGASMMVNYAKFHDIAPNWCAVCGIKLEKCENTVPKPEEECD